MIKIQNCIADLAYYLTLGEDKIPVSHYQDDIYFQKVAASSYFQRIQFYDSHPLKEINYKTLIEAFYFLIENQDYDTLRNVEKFNLNQKKSRAY